jgi:hypothetical protein
MKILPTEALRMSENQSVECQVDAIICIWGQRCEMVRITRAKKSAFRPVNFDATADSASSTHFPAHKSGKFDREMCF